MNNDKRSCINRKYYNFYAPTHDNPYPEFSCLKGHWDAISCSEEYDELFKDNDCNDFEKHVKQRRKV